MSVIEKAGKIAPWRAQPLSDAAKSAHFRQVMDLSAERILVGRSAVIAGWSVGAAGAVMLAASVAGWMMFLPLKTTDVKFLVVQSLAVPGTGDTDDRPHDGAVRVFAVSAAAAQQPADLTRAGSGERSAARARRHRQFRALGLAVA